MLALFQLPTSQTYSFSHEYTINLSFSFKYILIPHKNHASSHEYSTLTFNTTFLIPIYSHILFSYISSLTNQVEQLETQTREMNQIITELETRKAAQDEEIKASEEKITLLRDIIANLESQLEQKTTHEAEILEQLEQMRKTIDERDGKMRTLLGELESLKSEKVEQSDVTCVKCGQEEEKTADLLEKVKEQVGRTLSHCVIVTF